MVKKVDITEKLNFDENPKMVIKGVEIEVNADAETMLKIMGEFSSKSELHASLGAFQLFSQIKNRKRL